MIKLFKRLIEKLLYVGEDSTDTMARLDRRWRYWPSTYLWNGRIGLGIDTELVQYEGKQCKPRCVGGRYAEFIFDPRKWKIGYDHAYYDGPHHRSQFLMFAYYTDYADCKECWGDDE